MNKKQRRILRVLLEEPSHEMWSLPISEAVTGRTGAVHADLARLEADGLLDSRWGEAIAGRPRRRYYRLTDHGKAWALSVEEPISWMARLGLARR